MFELAVTVVTMGSVVVKVVIGLVVGEMSGGEIFVVVGVIVMFVPVVVVDAGVVP
ncbi:MAG: hypothetical protein ACRC6N_00025 [Plesiomonas sp.]|uniref:hypothetical protein n=1 Tax=Plesiomonas sp. TaxID=2486279 RepID=UPI003F3AD755